MIRLISIYFLLKINLLFGTEIELKGKIIDKTNEEPLLYVNIYNYTTHQKSKSNAEGNFLIKLESENDTVEIEAYGYETIRWNHSLDSPQTIIGMIPRTSQASETLTQDAAVELIDKCISNLKSSKIESKAFFELKSSINNNPVEMVESYFNLISEHSQPKEMQLKAGRVALKLNPYNNRYFTSQEIYNAFTRYNVLKSVDFLPSNPLEFDKKHLKKLFQFELEEVFLNDDYELIYKIKYSPKNHRERFFEGIFWINSARNDLEKVQLSCDSCSIHPFSPIYKTNKIDDVHLNIGISFATRNQKKVFEQLHFEYQINCHNNVRTLQEEEYTIISTGVLFAYDFGKSFILPQYELSPQIYSTTMDRINVYPYNDYFWTYNHEPRIDVNQLENKTLFDDNQFLTNRDFFNFSLKNEKLFERPLVEWSENRVNFVHSIEDQMTIHRKNNNVNIVGKVFLGKSNRLYSNKYYSDFNIKGKYEENKVYHLVQAPKETPFVLSVKLFVDINQIDDSIHIFTKTLFDPNESFCFLEMNDSTRCLINMYFDICEIERRYIESKMNMNQKNVSPNSIVPNLYSQYKTKVHQEFVKATEATNLSYKMTIWNNNILNKLHIDNIKLFQLNTKPAADEMSNL